MIQELMRSICYMFAEFFIIYSVCYMMYSKSLGNVQEKCALSKRISKLAFPSFSSVSMHHINIVLSFLILSVALHHTPCQLAVLRTPSSSTMRL
jgi:hypothetical protein